MAYNCWFSLVTSWKTSYLLFDYPSVELDILNELYDEQKQKQKRSFLFCWETKIKYKQNELTKTVGRYITYITYLLFE